MTDIKRDTLYGMKWSSIGSIANTAISFIMGIVLARLLDPSDFGILGMTAIFFSISYIFIDGGFGAALIRKRDLNDTDCSTVFYFGFVVSCFCYGLLFFAAPHIAYFLNQPILLDVIRVSGIPMVLGSLSSVHYSLMTKNVDFKHPALIKILANVLSGCLGIYMAYQGHGIWALIYQSLCSSVISVVSVWFVSTWRPKWTFSWESFKELFSFGGNLVLNSILDKLYSEGTSMLIGKFYSPKDLGFYSKGQGTAQMPSSFLANIIAGVTYPVLSKVQDNEETLIIVYRKYIKVMSMTIFFMILLLAAIARPLTILLYTEKWEPAILFVQLFCIRYLLYHIHSVNWNLILVKGRSDIAMKKELVNKTFNFTVLFISIPFGVVAICFAQIISTFFNLFVNTYVTGRVCGLGLRKQAADFIPYLFLSIITCLPAYLISMMPYSSIFTLLCGGMVSFILYFGYLWFKKDESLIALLRLSPVNKYVFINNHTNL